LRIVPEKGAGPARNGGVSQATGEVLAFTDSDCVAEPGWLAAGVEALSHSDVVGGAVKVLVSDPARVTPAEAFERIFAFNNRRYVEEERFTVTANMFCARSVFEKVGGFRVAISEDMDWSLRAGDAGYSIGFAGDAVVGHPARRTWPELLRKWRRLNSELLPLYKTRKYGLAIYLLRTLILPLSAVAHSPKVIFNRELARPGEKWAVLGVLYRLRFWRFFDSIRLLIEDGRRGSRAV
jgi:GT2 family glycosyltransferase